MKQEILNKLIASAELRNPGIFNASRERYIAEISFKKAIDLRDKEWIELLPNIPTRYNYNQTCFDCVKAIKSKMGVEDENT